MAEDMLQARRQCRLLRRREEAQRGAADGAAAAAAGHPGRDRQRPRHRRAEDRGGWRERAARRRISPALVITHYQRLLDYIVPDRVHVLVGGPDRRSRGGPELAQELEATGYASVQAGGMNAPLPTGAAGFLHRFEGLREPGCPASGMPWVQRLREPAAENFRAARLPDPAGRGVALHRPAPASPRPASSEPLTIARRATRRCRRAMARAARGVRRWPVPAGPVAAGGRRLRRRRAGRQLARLEGRLGALARPAEQPVVALNTMLFEDGLVVTVPAGVRRRAAGTRHPGQQPHRTAGRLPPAPSDPAGGRRQRSPSSSAPMARPRAATCTIRYSRSRSPRAPRLTHTRLQREGAARLPALDHLCPGRGGREPTTISP